MYKNISLGNCIQKKVVLCLFLLSLYALSPPPWLMSNVKDLTEYLSMTDSYCHSFIFLMYLSLKAHPIKKHNGLLA